MCMWMPSLTSPQNTQKPCPHGDYPNDKGICCNKCIPGFKLVEMCQAEGQRSNCTQCPDGQYSDQLNFNSNCFSCKRCKETKNEIQVTECKKHQNTICKCKPGYYKYNIDSVTYECRKCATCGANQKEKQECLEDQNTLCVCEEDYYKVKSKCEPCKNCTDECSHRCSIYPTIKEEPGHPALINIIAGVVALAILLLIVVVFITHKITKRSTKKKLLKLSPKQTSVPVDSRVLINVEEPWDNDSVKAVPVSSVSEQDSILNLPDCVPLEIKIPELIYTVLDLVPVLQVKQLVRTLGVKDTEIEQAEMDHRSCKEAHYQMLRVWVERESRAGVGGRGGMLHQPLLDKLLDELRNMHLGRAAEELEIKYGLP
ncbi:hypothetical protein Q5P01_011399 [Channa striata]|uniref:Tumor necrosis factor receptor superfamily member 1A n=1 Tax=Channa striata TaxID=64152 RepID=A0AA88MTB3_CHASR|nr:hypothetical protein Q5P01_011399 [Channa striata]